MPSVFQVRVDRRHGSRGDEIKRAYLATIHPFLDHRCGVVIA